MRETIGFSQELPIATWNCGGLSHSGAIGSRIAFVRIRGRPANLYRTVRKILLSCVKPTPESIFGDVPDLNITKAILDAKNRSKWKKLRPSSRC